ncbi:hypothetical protein [Streptomyces sp. 8N616]|uniref:hypothetical protein n=1 Tax=Streptomyces sp. 8N616 TaxID=3457414 RepID=UPI003FD285A5
MSTSEDITVGGLLVTEYERVKEEQQARIGFRDNLLYATLASMAAVIAAVLQRDGHAELLLLLPPVSVLLGWTYLVNDEKISAIGRYVRDELTPRLTALAGGQSGGQIFGWEVAHRSDRRRRSRKCLQLAVDLLTFCGASLAAVIVFWAAGTCPAMLIVVSVIEVAGIAVLAMQLVVYADLGHDARRTGA